MCVLCGVYVCCVCVLCVCVLCGVCGPSPPAVLCAAPRGSLSKAHSHRNSAAEDGQVRAAAAVPRPRQALSARARCQQGDAVE